MTTLVADHLWQSTVVATIAAVMAYTLRRSPARLRHALWLGASLKFLLPFSALVALGQSIEWRAPAVAPVLEAAAPFAEPFAAVAGITIPSAVAATSAPAWAWVPTILASLWAMGTCVMVSRWLAAWWAIRRIALASEVATSGRDVAILRSLTKGANAPQVSLLLTDNAMEPGVFGVWRPALLWPRDISARLTDQQIAAIMAHEIAHVRRRDNLAALLHMTVRVLFWFHPMLAWIETRMLCERERACDEAVIAQGNEPQAYAEGLLKTCEFYVESSLVCVAGVTGADLKVRVATIMRSIEQPRLSRAASALVATLASTMLVAPLVVGLLAAPPLQTPGVMLSDNDEAFEVASIKPSADQSGLRSILFQRGGRFTTNNMPLRTIIAAAYGGRVPLQQFRVVGGPSWIESERYTINAKSSGDLQPEDGAPAAAMFGMLRTMLTERFQLKVRTEVRQADIYRLVRARPDGALGPGLRKSSVDCTALRTSGVLPPPLLPGGMPVCGGRFSRGRLTFNGLRVTELAGRDLTRTLEHVVIDDTGLQGDFDVTLEWTPEAPAGTPTGEPGVSIFTAVREQLGLKLEPARGPVEFLVIDRVERPTPD